MPSIKGPIKFGKDMSEEDKKKMMEKVNLGFRPMTEEEKKSFKKKE